MTTSLPSFIAPSSEPAAKSAPRSSQAASPKASHEEKSSQFEDWMERESEQVQSRPKPTRSEKKKAPERDAKAEDPSDEASDLPEEEGDQEASAHPKIACWSPSDPLCHAARQDQGTAGSVTTPQAMAELATPTEENAAPEMAFSSALNAELTPDAALATDLSAENSAQAAPASLALPTQPQTLASPANAARPSKSQTPAQGSMVSASTPSDRPLSPTEMSSLPQLGTANASRVAMVIEMPKLELPAHAAARADAAPLLQPQGVSPSVDRSTTAASNTRLSLTAEQASETMAKALEQATPPSLPRRIQMDLQGAPGGSVSLQLTLRNGQMHAQLEASTPQAFDWAQQQLATLKLIQAGIAIRWLPVQTPAKKESFDQQQQQSHQDQGDPTEKQETSESERVTYASGGRRS